MYTKGPWKQVGVSCVLGDGPQTRVVKYHPGAGAYQTIGQFGHEFTNGSDCEGNARLAAAAPDMLEALKAIAKDINPRTEGHLGIIRQLCIVQIFEATGESI